MPLILPGNVATELAGASYSIANSCRFASGDSAYMHFTPSAGGDQKTFTVSFWVKMGKLGVTKNLFSYAESAGSNPRGFMGFIDTSSGYEDRLAIATNPTASAWHYPLNFSSKAFYDPSAWYHLVMMMDTTQSTEADRFKLYINGIEYDETVAVSSPSYPDEDADTGWNSEFKHSIGVKEDTDSMFFDGYIAEFIMCEGTAYAASDFGEFDSDSPSIWKPKDPSGLTFGDEGYWLDFEDSSALGNDVSGNNNDFTVVNLAAVDQATDSPTNNFCVMNPLDNYYESATFAEGSCKVTTNSGSYAYSTSTFGLTAGKWYWEIEINAQSSTDLFIAGIAARPPTATNNYLGADADAWGIYAGIDGYTVGGSDTSDWCDNFTDDDILMFGLDLDNNKLYAGLNGNWCDGSGNFDESDIANADGIDITAPASLTSGAYFPAAGYRDNTGTATYLMNFGGCPAFSISSAQSDDNSLGTFEFNPPTGYLSICTKNLGSDGG